MPPGTPRAGKGRHRAAGRDEPADRHAERGHEAHASVPRRGRSSLSGSSQSNRSYGPWTTRRGARDFRGSTCSASPVAAGPPRSRRRWVRGVAPAVSARAPFATGAEMGDLEL